MIFKYAHIRKQVTACMTPGSDLRGLIFGFHSPQPDIQKICWHLNRQKVIEQTLVIAFRAIRDWVTGLGSPKQKKLSVLVLEGPG